MQKTAARGGQPGRALCGIEECWKFEEKGPCAVCDKNVCARHWSDSVCMCTECRAKEVKETKEREERERKEWQKNNLSNINENGSEHSHEQAEVVVEEKVIEHWNKEKEDMSDLLKNVPNMGEFQKWLQDRLRYIASCSVHPEHALEYLSLIHI